MIVVGLVGERGREVRDFVERDLGPAGLARSVVVVATGDDILIRPARTPTGPPVNAVDPAGKAANPILDPGDDGPDAEEDVADAENDGAHDKARERLEQLNTLKAVLGR